MRLLIELCMLSVIVGLFFLMADMSEKYSTEIDTLKAECSINEIVQR